tara:strand:- start:314 stop:1309 length:996 start_codon:yes stop_codon:yes gene_type:complete
MSTAKIVFMLLSNMQSCILLEYFTSLPEISDYKENSIFTEALNLVNNLLDDIVQQTSIKEVHILRNYKLRKKKIRKVVYHITSPEKNIFSILKSFPKNSPLIFIAPETDGISLKIIKKINNKFFLLHSPPQMVELFSSKRETYKALQEKEIPCIPEKKPHEIKKNFIIIKPEHGAGSEEVYYLKKSNVTISTGVVCQEYYSGRKASFSMICKSGQSSVLGCNIHIMKKEKRRFFQVGSLIGGAEKYRNDFESLARKISQRFSNLYGFIGVDVVKFLDKWYVVEINCRFTSSYIGLKTVYGENIVKTIFNLYFQNVLSSPNIIVEKNKRLIF